MNHLPESVIVYGISEYLDPKSLARFGRVDKENNQFLHQKLIDANKQCHKNLVQFAELRISKFKRHYKLHFARNFAQIGIQYRQQQYKRQRRQILGVHYV